MKFLLNLKKSILCAILMCALLTVTILSVGVRINAKDIGTKVGTVTGNIVGTVTGSLDGLTDGRHDGQIAGEAVGLRADDIVLKIKSSFEQTNSLTVYEIKTSLVNRHIIGENSEYVSLVRYNNVMIVFSLDLNKIKVISENDELLIVLPDLTYKTNIDASDKEVIAEKIDFSFNLSDSDGVIGAINSIAKLESTAPTLIKNFDVFLSSAENHAKAVITNTIYKLFIVDQNFKVIMEKEMNASEKHPSK